MKRVHDLLDRSCPIPPVHVQDIDIRGAQFLEGCLDGDVEGLCVIPAVIHLVGGYVYGRKKKKRKSTKARDASAPTRSPLRSERNSDAHLRDPDLHRS
jgi:hypothetical protein